MEGLGTHCFADLYECPPDLLNDVTHITNSVRESASQGMATLLHEVSHQFVPHGVTALGLIAESHIAIHTWPEHGFAAVDVFTCGDRASAERACAYLAKAMRSRNYSLRKVSRGDDIVSAKGAEISATTTV